MNSASCPHSVEDRSGGFLPSADNANAKTTARLVSLSVIATLSIAVFIIGFKITGAV